MRKMYLSILVITLVLPLINAQMFGKHKPANPDGTSDSNSGYSVANCFAEFKNAQNVFKTISEVSGTTEKAQITLIVTSVILEVNNLAQACGMQGLDDQVRVGDPTKCIAGMNGLKPYVEHLQSIDVSRTNNVGSYIQIVSLFSGMFQNLPAVIADCMAFSRAN